MKSWVGQVISVVTLATAAVAGCATTEAEEVAGTEDAVSSGLLIEEDTSLLVEHPETLKALEAGGFDLGSRLTGAAMTNNVAFAASEEGKSIIAAVEQDVATAKAGDRQLGVGMAFSHRAFDARWLASKEARFELVAVANRLDRRHASAETDGTGCGEVHLVYRLAYANPQGVSRLPMTLMLVYPQIGENGSCTKTAQKWLATKSASTFAAKADAVAAGPLAALPKLAPKVETNFQLVRWPSTTRTDMGGHAEYSLRVFSRSDDAPGLAPVYLENTPREDLDDAAKAALAKWVAANVDEIDKGTAQIPLELEGQRILAETAISVSPKGLARAQNRPFASLFGRDGAAFADAKLDGLELVKSKAALVRRLDTMACNGCHQSQGIAGFHVVGHDRAEMDDINALIQGVSAHAREQVSFRRQDLVAVAGGSAELGAIPFAERNPNSGAFAVEGGYGSACGLGDPGFATWTCGEGFKCSDINGEQVGMCVTNGRARKGGEACEESTTTFDANPHKDKVREMKVVACSLPSGGAGRCVRSGGDPGGFPTGMCGGSCGKTGEVFADGSICGVAVPSGFNACVGAGKPFAQCASGGPKALRKKCSATEPCGQDYVCSAVPGAPAGVGACLPPYFIFQARVDGHNVGR
ncbi:MAG: hypothetical protein KIT84_34005 [Labilithrix sp.]|nr:hypothetical protein [Labilithrix sp.]MCW5816062.1 hypothetical protein [Labilithrix sp.]